MRGNVPAYEMITPRSLGDALERMSREPGRWKPFAGGTDLMVLLEAGALKHREFINFWGLDELRGIEVREDWVSLGALTTYSQVLSHPVLKEEFPSLARAARETGAWAIQNRGTLGGNIANASPAADSPPALLVYGAELELLSTRGARWVPYDTFHTGYKQTVLAQNEIVSRVRLPRPRGERLHFYRKVGPRKAQAISKVCFAGFASKDVVRIALGGVAPVVKRCPAAEAAIKDLARAKEAIAKEISPIDDVRSSARYRAKVVENLWVDFVLRQQRHVGLAG